MKAVSSFLVLSALLVSGCSTVGVATGAGATVGIAAAQEGGIRGAVSDAAIQVQINSLWFQYDVDAFRKLDMTVDQGRVLLTGVVQDPEMRVEAVRLAWQPKGVKQVINEIQIDEGGGFLGFARDNWITTRLRTSLTLNKDVQSINYSIDTVRGVVYLMGTAQNQDELNRVIETARTVPDVRRVVSYVKMAGAPLSEAPTQAGQSAYDDMQVVPPTQSDGGGYDSGVGTMENDAPMSIKRDSIERESL